MPGPFVQLWFSLFCKFYITLFDSKDWFHFCVILSEFYKKQFRAKHASLAWWNQCCLESASSFLPIQSLEVCFSLEPSGRALRLGRFTMFHDDWVVDGIGVAPTTACPHLCVTLFSVLGSGRAGLLFTWVWEQFVHMIFSLTNRESLGETQGRRRGAVGF